MGANWTALKLSDANYQKNKKLEKNKIENSSAFKLLQKRFSNYKAIEKTDK